MPPIYCIRFVIFGSFNDLSLIFLLLYLKWKKKTNLNRIFFNDVGNNKTVT